MGTSGGGGACLLTRREAIRMGLAGGAMAWLGSACQEVAAPPEPPEPPATDPVYELAPGSSLYDDFDGHGNFQTFDNRDLAAAGALAAKLWIPGAGARVVESALTPLPPPAGMPAAPDRVLELRCGDLRVEEAKLANPALLGFADLGSFSADMLLSSRSTAPRPFIGLNLHTSIPEQPPGKSWYCTLGIFKNMAGPGALAVGLYGNVNLEIVENDLLAAIDFDEWHTFRLNIATKADDPSLGDQDVRLEYYLDGTLMAARIPEDSPILIDPSRLGFGPYRSLIISRDWYEGEAFGYFNNVRAVYRDRIA